MVMVYPVGTPLLYEVLLLEHREDSSSTDCRSVGALKVRAVLLECAARRIMLTGVVVFISPNDVAQIAVTIIMLVLGDVRYTSAI
ncbi:unnamed protein product [Ectocarpus sp. 6 AP-2014]